MTDQSPAALPFAEPTGSRTDILLEKVTVYRMAPELLLFDALMSLFALGERCPREAMAWLLDAALSKLETAGPFVSFSESTVREGAEFWAEVASPREVEVYFGACLRRLMRDRGRLNTAAQKRLMVALWEALPEADRAKFLRGVDPDGRFRKP